MTHAMAHKDNGSAMFGVAAMAALLGAAAALLLAPRSGKDTRDDLMRKMHEAQERSKHKATEMKDTAAGKMDEVHGKTKEMTDEAATEVQDAVAEARSQVEDAAAEMQPRPRSRRTTL